MRTKFFVGIVAIMIALSSCSDDSGQTAAGVSSADQTEIIRYNSYIKVARASAGQFGRTLDEHVGKYSSAVKAGGPLEAYEAVRAFEVNEVGKAIEEALKLPDGLPGLHDATQAFGKALADFRPMNSELDSYAQSKGYLSDGGEMARKMDAAFVESLTKVADAERAFLDMIDAEDDKRTRATFEAAEKDSLAYYRAGVIVYTKQATRALNTALADPKDGAALGKATESLDQLAAMARGIDLKRNPEDKQCGGLVSTVNSAVGKARGILQKIESGGFNPGDMAAQVPVSFAASAFSRIISNLNRGDC